MLKDIQKYAGRKQIIEIYDNWSIDFLTPLIDQAEHLHEDIIQISFRKNYILDIGWYPEHSANGKFRGVLIESQDWGNPIFEIETTDCHSLTDWTIEVIELVFDF